MTTAIGYALNGFLPDTVDDENALRKKSGTIFTELKLSVVQELDCKSRKAFIDEFSFAILTQRQ